MEACGDYTSGLFKCKSDYRSSDLHCDLRIKLQSNGPFNLNQSPELAGVVFQVEGPSVQEYICVTPADTDVTDPDVSVVSADQCDPSNASHNFISVNDIDATNEVN